MIDFARIFGPMRVVGVRHLTPSLSCVVRPLWSRGATSTCLGRVYRTLELGPVARTLRVRRLNWLGRLWYGAKLP